MFTEENEKVYDTINTIFVEVFGYNMTGGHPRFSYLNDLEHLIESADSEYTKENMDKLLAVLCTKLDAQTVYKIREIVRRYFGGEASPQEKMFDILCRVLDEHDYGDGQGWGEELRELDLSTLTKEKVLEILTERRGLRDEKIAESARKMFDWEGLVEDAKANYEEFKGDMSEYDEPHGTVYLGSCFALCPSGKYYQPWASSNLSPCPVCEGKAKIFGDEDCPWCSGQDGSCGTSEAVDDEAFYVGLDGGAESVGGWIESGEGDPCDIFFGIAVEEDEEEESEDEDE